MKGFNMKKSTFLMLGSALLAISIGAAASSTYAWFTSSTVVNAAFKNMTAVSTEGDLYVDWDTSYTASTNDYGIADVGGADSARNHAFRANPYNVTDTVVHDVANNDYDGITFQNLRDASIDLTKATPKAYKAELDGVGGITGNYTQVADSGNSLDTSSGTYYFVKLKLRFIVKSQTNLKAYHIFMSNATFTNSDATKKIDSAVRMGIKPYRGTNNTVTEDDVYSVWAPDYNQTDKAPDGTTVNGTTLKYVSGTTTLGDYEYASAVSDAKKGFSSTVGTLAYDNTTYGSYIGEVGSATSRNWVTYGTNNYYSYIDCDLYFWFEGSDVLCNKEQIQTTAYSLACSFRAIKQA